MFRVILLVLLVAVIAGLGYLGSKAPSYHPQLVSQPVALPDANAPR